VLGGITGAITGSATSASYAANASFLNGLGSEQFVPTGSFNTFSSSILTYTGSVNSRLGSLETTSGSNITRLGALEVASGSAITRLNSIETVTGSNITRLSSLEAKTGSYATTGSNTFDGGQYLSSSFNPTGFSTTASLYTDGGLRVTRDAYISGTLYLNNVTVFGTQSVAYISSSQLNIGTNLITVNTDTPSIRFGGLAVYDSGSTGLTGSLLWDSQNNHWVYSNPSGSSYSGGMFISGPRTSTLGSETGTTSCALMMGQGGDHITSSAIFHYGNATCFYGNSFISSSGDACFAGNLSAKCIGVGTPTPGQLIDAYKNDNDAIIKVSTCAAGAYFAADSQGTDGYYGLILQNNGNDRWLIGGYSTTDLIFTTARTGGSRYLTISRATGVACFSSTVCAPSLVANTLTLNTTTADYAATITNVQDSSQGLLIRATDNDTSLYLLNLQSSPGAACQSWVDRFAVTKGGNVGVGLSNPSCYYSNQLVVSAGSEGGITIANPSTTGAQYLMFADGTSGADRYRGYMSYNHTDNSMTLATDANTRFTITGTGIACFACQVCVANLISSGQICSVGDNKNLDIGGVAVIRGNGSAYATHYLTTGAANVAAYYQANASGTNVNKIAAGEHSYFNSGCNVGIGYYSPSFRLDVCSGDAQTARFARYCAGTGNTNGQIAEFVNLAVAGYSSYIYIGSSPGTDWKIGKNVTNCNANYDFTIVDSSNFGRMRITPTGEVCFACQVCASRFISNDDFNIRNTLFSTTGTLSKLTWTNLYPSTYNVADIGVQLDGNYYNGAIVFRTADADNANVLVERMRMESRGVTCFRNTVCAPTMVVSAGPLRIGPDAAQSTLHVNSGNDGNKAAFIHSTGTQRFSMYGKYIQSYGGTAVNVPLFVACGMANTGIMVKVNIYGSNAVSAMRYEDAGYAGIYYIGGGLQGSPNASITTICNLGGVGHGIGTLYWGNTGSNPVLYYCQANNGYIAESIDVHITIRDSANVYFYPEFISCG
jgi:hypothetical protein